MKVRFHLLRSRLRAWLASSVHRRTAAALLVVTLAFTFVVNTTSYLAARRQLQQNLEGSLVGLAAREADRVAYPLATVTAAVTSLARSPLLSNSLVDSEGRGAYLAPFLRDYQPGVGIPLVLTLCDFRGASIASSRGAQRGYAGLPWVADVVEGEQSHAELVELEGRRLVRVAFPVRHPETRTSEGMLVAEIDLAPLLAAEASPLEGSGRRVVDGAGLAVATDAASGWQDWITSRRVVPVPPLLASLGLAVEVGVPRALAFRPLTWLSVLFTAGSVVMVGLALLVAGWLARRLTGPILSLSEAAGRIAASGKFDAGVPVQGEDEVARLATTFNDMLQRLQHATETKVAELRARNEELLRMHAESKRLELELHQAQKLEAVGQLAAGIAHEINTPIQYIGDNTRFLQEAVGVLSARTARLREVAAVHAPPELNAELDRQAEEMDLEYVLQQAEPTIKRTLDGAQRVATIVRAMKEFAHPDQKEMVATDLNRAIQATLEVARNEYKYVAEIETDLQPLPLVTCHPGEVNQVFLNVIVNAAHAIGAEVKGTGRRGQIAIRSRADEGWVEVEIHDDGPGIPEAIRAKVFEPFFTTKEVGRGTGQGLAIARNVVEKHGGSIRFQTAEGLGTTFSIRLPVAGPPARTA